MGATLTTANNILKEIYEPRIRDQLENWNVASKRIEQTSEGVTSEVGGKYVVFPVHTKRNQGIGARLEMEQLPSAGVQGYQRAQVSLAYLYGAVQLSGQSMELANSNFQAFASVLDEEVSGIQTDLARDYNRQFFGTSVGAMATANAAYAASANFPTANTQYIQVGMIVDVYDSTGVTLRLAGATVNSVTQNTTVVLSAAVPGGASGDILVRTGNINRETIGISQIVSNSGVLYNIDPAVEAQWKSVMMNNGGTLRALSEGLMINMIDNIYTNGGNVTVMFTTLGVRRAYFNLLTQQRRYTSTQEFDGGFKGLGFTTDRGEVPLVTDIDCQPNKMYFLNEKEFKIYCEGEWSFMNRDGSQWQRVIGYDAYTATLFKYCQLGTHRRNTHGLLSDITEG